ncbi:SusC/RagA family TonB-linked outer membrane protein [Flavivirga eckloniae]|nr:TonB-dependent receptor [Flavivirga eckloniae]
MKTFIFLLCSTVLALSPASTFSQGKIRIDVDKTVPVDEIFKLIKQQTEYTFIYEKGIFRNLPDVQLKKGVISIDKLLKKGLSNNNFKYILSIDNTILIKQKGENQQKIVSGIVTDESGTSIAGVTVLVKGTSIGVATDFDGSFSLVVPAPENVLIISSLGYKTTEITVGDQTTINITLEEETSNLEEVVIIGYGATTKKNLTGSVGTVESEDLTRIQTQTIDQALVGQLSGVFVNSGGGAPGSAAIVNIRGLTSLTGSNQPLYIIDGVPIIITPSYDSGGLGFFQEQENPLLSINPNDVERIDVLKDASAAAIYGSRAANGVVIITTKQGKRNQAPRFNISYNATVLNTTQNFDVLNTSQYRQFFEDNGNDPANLLDANTNWQDLVTNDNALWNQLNLSISGGTSKTSYYASTNFSEQEGVLIGTRFNRYGMNIRLDSDVMKNLKLGANLSYNYSLRKESGITSLREAALTRPDLPVFNDDGTFTGLPDFDGNILLNPLGDEATVRDRGTSQNLNASFYGEYSIFNNLKFKSQISINVSDSRGETFSPSTTETAFSEIFFSGNSGAVLNTNAGQSVSTTLANTLNYKNTFKGGHTIDVLAGITWDRSRFDLQANKYVGFPDDNLLVGIGNATNLTEADSDASILALNSLIGRVNYNYKDRYLVTLTGRSDTSIKFGPGNRTGFFPSAAAAWNMHNESFLKDNNLISSLKLRASWGLTGLDNLPAFTYRPSYATGGRFDNTVYNGINGIEIFGLPNPNIRWEETEQLDLGLEFSLFNNRINAEVVYFEKNTSGLITNAPAVLETGFRNFDTNIADVSNKGWELNLIATVIQSENFRWDTSFNISSIKNKVESLNGGGSDLLGIVEGEPIGAIRGFDVVKIAQTQEEIDALNDLAGFYYFGTEAPGDYIFRDVNGDGEIINEDDEVVLGNITPDYYGGWSNKFSYKNLDLSFTFQFVEGVEKLNREVGNLGFFSTDQNQYARALETWTPENPNAKYARLNSFSLFEFSSAMVEDASYIRLRSASIGYNFPSKLFKNTALSGARLTLSGNNLLTITDYTGQDPEAVIPVRRGNSSTELTDDEGTSYPQTRTVTLGLKLNF